MYKLKNVSTSKRGCRIDQALNVHWLNVGQAAILRSPTGHNPNINQRKDATEPRCARRA